MIELKCSSNISENSILRIESVKSIISYTIENGIVKARLIVEDAERSIPEIIRFIEKMNGKVYSVSPIFISLEEAFIKLTCR